MQHDFTPTRPASSLNPMSRRRLSLLQEVLPFFAQAALEIYRTSERFSSTREFWAQFLTPCFLMESGGWRFDRVDNRHHDLLKHTLQCLDLIVGIEYAEIDEAYTSSSFPRLEALRSNIRTNQIKGDKGLFGCKINLAKPINLQSCTDIIGALGELADVLKDESKQPSPEEAPVESRLKPLLAPILLHLFSTISKYFQQCRCAKPHKAILLLFTHRAAPKDGLYSFKLLFTRESTDNGWTDAVVTIKELLSKSEIQIPLPDSMNQLGRHNSARNTVLNLCRSIEQTAKSSLHLCIERGSVYQQTINGPSITKVLSEGIYVSLSEGLLANETEMDMNSQFCLAVVLSYSLLDYCGEPWFPGGWTRDNIYFLQQGQYLSLRPALITCVQSIQEDSQASRIPRDLKLLFHGILLMEIFRQEALPVNLYPDQAVDIANIREFALIEFKTRTKWGVCERYRQSVEACLRGIEIDDASDNDGLSFARAFCQSVIKPLEAGYTTLWGDRDPDEVVSKLKMPIINPRRPPPQPPKPAHLRGNPKRTANSLQFPAPLLKFFDTVDNPDPKQIEGAKRWFDRFDRDDLQEQLPKRPKDKNKRIKIAVLDTGIDMTNSWIQQRSGKLQCWPDDKACHDTDGHGTQVAYLLLRLAPHAHLRIAKVGKSQLLNDTAIEDIVKAIRHFSSSSPENKVDIINLSFGFPKFQKNLMPILQAIRAARERNVLVFAAAGNGGGNQGICWPASLHRTGDVICIHASDSDGNASGFNPTTGLNNRICTQGEALPSCEKDTQGEIIYRSGTSFATPVAVAIAAIVLGFADAVPPNDAPSDFDWIKERLRKKSGMERILHRMCVLAEEKRRVGYSYITPWFFLDVEEKSRAHILANELRSIPE